MNRQSYTVYPRRAIFDHTLTAGARLLYGVIFTDAVDTGYCCATNQGLGDCIRVSPDRASAYVSELVRHDYVRRELGDGGERRLYPLVS